MPIKTLLTLGDFRLISGQAEPAQACPRRPEDFSPVTGWKDLMDKMLEAGVLRSVLVSHYDENPDARLDFTLDKDWYPVVRAMVESSMSAATSEPDLRKKWKRVPDLIKKMISPDGAWIPAVAYKENLARFSGRALKSGEYILDSSELNA